MPYAKSEATPYKTIISLDPFKPGNKQEKVHNRWHPDIPAVAEVKPGQIFNVTTVDWTGGQIGNTDDSDDIKDVDLTQIHYLSGPIAVDGAKQGDCLVVDILDVRPLDDMPWGYTGIFELTNGGGLLATTYQSRAAKAIWNFEGVHATSRHIPKVRFAGIPHPGIIGTAPSKELLEKWNRRENELINENKDALPPVAYPPNELGAYVGQPDLTEECRKKIAKEGARTIPGRENGGNCDIKNLSRGSTCYLPVFIDGANLSIGDLHFSQGDGEMTFCGGVEMAGVVQLRTKIIKNGMYLLGLNQPMFIVLKPSPVDPLYSQKLVFEGISVDINEGGSKQYNMDATVAYKQAAQNCINYLVKLGYTREQAYLLLSAAPVDSHIGAIVDSPNACVTLAVPTQIFEFDILPNDNGLNKQKDLGQCAIRSDGLI